MVADNYKCTEFQAPASVQQ